MKKFLSFLKESAWVMYLGGILSVAELYANDYKWWIILFPTILLNEFLNNNNNK